MKASKCGTTEVPDEHKFRLSLSAERRANPELVIREFLDNYELDELNEINRNWLFEALGQNKGIYDDGQQREKLLFFHGKLNNLLEAVYVIYGKHPVYQLPEHKTA